MATYNGAKYIREQIDSILIQLRDNDELIISDDDSKDETLSIINEIKDSRIKIVKGPCKGHIQNFSNAVMHATGDIIFFSDQDDIWDERKVENVLSSFKDNIFVMHNATIFDELANTYGQHLFTKTPNFNILHNLCKHQTYGCCIAFHSKLKKYAFPIPDNKYLLHETWLSILAKYFFSKQLVYIDIPLIKYRRHCNNVSIMGTSNRYLYIKLKERIVMLYYIIIRIFSLSIKRSMSIFKDTSC